MQRSNRLKCQAVSFENAFMSTSDTYQCSPQHKLTMSAHDLNNESTFSLAFSILNGYITFFNSCILLPHRITHPALENGEEGLIPCQYMLE